MNITLYPRLIINGCKIIDFFIVPEEYYTFLNKHFMVNVDILIILDYVLIIN
jgi:hypothetical protein